MTEQDRKAAYEQHSTPESADQRGSYEAPGLVLDLFAGSGGWSQGLRMLGLSDVGIELDEAACLTRKAAGHLTIRADVASYPMGPFVGKTWGLIASPPCQDFSQAGRRAGIAGVTGRLVREPLRWAEALRPDWIALEQVPEALRVWHSMIHPLVAMGYRVAVGILNAADYGVPQVRRRAFLLAGLGRNVSLPHPTHSEHGGDSLWGNWPQWVTMADAIGRGLTESPAPVVMTARNRQGGADVLRGSSWRAEWLEKEYAAGRWLVAAGVTGMGAPRPDTGPAPTITSKGTAYWLNDPGDWKDRTASKFRVTVVEAGVLQSFPADYPWQGTSTERYRQVGNAVSPLLAAHVLSSVTGLALPTEVAA